MSRRTAVGRAPAASRPRPARRAPAPGPAPGRRALREELRALRVELRAGLRNVPRVAWVCAVVAILNAACWSILSPPFEVPDEPSHFAYVQHLAETGSLPAGSGETFPRAEQTVLTALRVSKVRFNASQTPVSTPAEQRALNRALAAPLSRSSSAQAGVAASQPPLYYALEVVPYELGGLGDMLDRVALMRLLSALMAGATALFAFLFLREALPGAPWAWTVGGLGVALAPLLGLMSGAVNPDALLFAVCAALFYCLARGFRRGLTPRLAAVTGAVVAAGLLTKLTFASLVPGAALGLLVLIVRDRSRETLAFGQNPRFGQRAPRAGGGARADADTAGPQARAPRTGGRPRPHANAASPLALLAAAGACPVVAALVLAALAGPSRTGAISGTLSGAGGGRTSLLGEVSYIWQFYLPRLPGMTTYFHGFLTTRTVWFDGLVGLYGWLDTTFPNWVYDLALLPAAALAALFARAVLLHRETLRARLPELGVYLAISAGLLLTIGAVDYQNHLPTEYAEPRYLLPLLALWGAVLALAARGAGRRWGPAAGALIVMLLLAHDLFSGLLVVSRYYG